MSFVMHRTTRVALAIIGFQAACLAGVIGCLASGTETARVCRSSLGDGYIELHCQREFPNSRDRKAGTILANEPLLPSAPLEPLASLRPRVPSRR